MAALIFLLMPAGAFAQTPPMYINSYYGYGNDIDQTKMSNYVAMLRYAQQFGWNILELDDGWSAGLSTNNITLVDSTKFPNGLAWLFDLIHSNGLNGWIYTELRTNTDGGLFGTGTNLIGNAQVFATNYLVDGVIYHGDWYLPPAAAMTDMLTFGDVLRSNRPGIFLQSLNPSPNAAVNDGFRTEQSEFFTQSKPQTGYPFADFIFNMADAQAALYLFNANRDSIRPGHYLVPLNAYSYPNNDPAIQVNRASLTINSLMSCGFVTGSGGLQSLPPMTSIYCNPDVISVCQDRAVLPAALAKQTVTGTGTNEIWVKPLGGMNTATKALGLFNWDANHAATVSFTASDANLPTNQQYVLYNCWSNAVSGFLTNNAFSVSMPGGTVQLFKLYPKDLVVASSSFGISNGQFSLQAGVNAGPAYAVQVSSNLTDWQTVFTTNSPLKPFRWEDNTGTTPAARFYRVKNGPPLP